MKPHDGDDEHKANKCLALVPKRLVARYVFESNTKAITNKPDIGYKLCLLYRVCIEIAEHHF